MTAVPGYGAAPLAVGFYVNSVDPDSKGFVSYVWNFGDGQVSMDPPLTFFHTYTVAGSYVATVTATTADGRTAIAYVGVRSVRAFPTSSSIVPESALGQAAARHR